MSFNAGRQALAEPDEDRTQSPSWLKPVVMPPSEGFKVNVQAIDHFFHVGLVDVIFSNCRVTCFDFYHASRLWRTRYSIHDELNDPKLFQLENGGFPKSAGDLTLRDWLVKIQHAESRLDEYDSIQVTALYDFHGINDPFKGITRICSLNAYAGRLDIGNLEECLLISLRLCQHINGWESFSRLKVLWEELHSPSEGIGKFNPSGLRLEHLRPFVKELRPTDV